MSTTPAPGPILLADEQAAIQALTNIFSDRDSKLISLKGQLSDSQKAFNDLQQKFLALTADDTSVAGQLAAAQNLLSRYMLLSQAQSLLNLHLLPVTQDPNARPLQTWFQPSNAGDTGGTDPTKTHGTWSITQNPDFSTDFLINPGYPFNAFYFSLHLLNKFMALGRFLQYVQYEIADEDLPNAMAQETNFEHNDKPDGATSNYRFNHGFQALFGQDKDCETGKLVSHVWRHYDIGFKSPITGKVGNWRTLAGIPFDIGMFGTGNKVELLHEIEQSPDPTQGMQIVSVTINKTRYPIGRWTQAKATTWGPYLDNGFQMDSLKTAAPWKCKVWNMEAYWM